MPWVAENRSLSQSERENNARIIYDILGTWGWSLNAVCGVLGNMEVESGLSPAVVQNFATNNPPNLGYGLIQWTSDVTNVHNNTLWAWTYRNYGNYNWQDGDHQLIFINGEDGQNYYTTSPYPIRYNDFKVSTQSPEYLAKAYFYNRERGTWSDLRASYARKWFNFFGGETENPDEPVPPEPPVPPVTPNPEPKKHMKLYMYPCWGNRYF